MANPELYFRINGWCHDRPTPSLNASDGAMMPRRSSCGTAATTRARTVNQYSLSKSLASSASTFAVATP